MRSNAAARLEVAKNKSSALIKEANSESSNSAKMEGMRRHTEKMRLAGSLQDVSFNGKMVVAGKNGEAVLDFYKDTLNLVGSR